jgi:hypothetical protein
MVVFMMGLDGGREWLVPRSVETAFDSAVTSKTGLLRYGYRKGWRIRQLKMDTLPHTGVARIRATENGTEAGNVRRVRTTCNRRKKAHHRAGETQAEYGLATRTLGAIGTDIFAGIEPAGIRTRSVAGARLRRR